MKHDGSSQGQIINYMRWSDASGNLVTGKSPVYAASQTTLNMLDRLTGEKGDEIPILIATQSKRN